MLRLVNSPEYRDLPVGQIVPRLAEAGHYIASESTIYRILRAEKQNRHRTASKPPVHHRPRELRATGPNQVWSWDITYLRTPVLGRFFYLYLVMDVWSRKIVAAAVHEREDGSLASRLLEEAFVMQGVEPDQLILHSDRGSPMRSATLLATLQELGVTPSFSRPRVSDDNPYSESTFRTMKYRPEFPSGAFQSLKHAIDWVEEFVRWYNHEHRHSGIRFVTPHQRHSGADVALLESRKATYEAAKKRHPERWTGATRCWDAIEIVRLNPEPTRQSA